MKSPHKPTTHIKYGLPEIIFFGGVLLSLIGGLNYLSSRSHKNIDFVHTSGSPSIIQRKLSIEVALKNGQKTYQYQSHMIPGIGVISDPDAYLSKLEEEVKKNSEN